MLAAIFGRMLSPRVTQSLPLEVSAAIAASTVVDRGEYDGERRILLMSAGRGGFVFAADPARAWLESSFPGLTQPQTTRALALIADHVAQWQRSAMRANQDSQRPAWRAWKPLEL